MPPCSGWCANAAALTRSSSASSPGRNDRTVKSLPPVDGVPVGSGSSDLLITHSSRTRSKPVRRARAAAAGWSPCDQASHEPSRSPSAASSNRPPYPLSAVRRRHDQVQQVAVDDREAGVLLDADVELFAVVSQPAPGALVERFGTVGRRAGAG